MHRSQYARTCALALTLLASSGAACADAEAPITTDPAGEVSAVGWPIINGFAPDAPRHDATVALLQRSGGYVSTDISCSGTLVTPTVVVTAAHCLEVIKGRKVSAVSPSSIAVFVGDRTTPFEGSAWAVVETKIHPQYDRRSLLNDIGLLRLAGPIEGVEPVPVLPASLGFSSAQIGETLNFAGFGDDENGQYNVKLQANGSLGGLGCTVSGCYGAHSTATQISYTQYDSGPCYGDSGGPAFVERGGVWYLGGVTSWGDDFCTQFGVSTRADAFEGWIADFAGVPVDPPVCEADGACNAECPAGADPDCDTGGGSCGDRVCGAGESCDGRGGNQACPSDCAGQTNGKPSGRFCYVQGVCEGPGC